MQKPIRNSFSANDSQTLMDLQMRIAQLEEESLTINDLTHSSTRIAMTANRLQIMMDRLNQERTDILVEIETRLLTLESERAAAIALLNNRITALDQRRVKDASALNDIREEAKINLSQATDRLTKHLLQTQKRNQNFSDTLNYQVESQNVALETLQNSMQARLNYTEHQQKTQSASLAHLQQSFAEIPQKVSDLTQDFEQQLTQIDTNLKNNASHLVELKTAQIQQHAQQQQFQSITQTLQNSLESEKNTVQATRQAIQTLSQRADYLVENTETLIKSTHTLSERTEQLETLSGDKAAFQKTTAEILSKALREAGAQNPEQLSNAITPYVIKPIQTEIMNSKSVLIELIQPEMGRLVRGMIASAIENLNQRVENALPFDRWMAAIKGKLNLGSPVAHLSNKVFYIEEVFLIDRNTGILLAHHMPNSTKMPAEHLVDEDLMSGMLSTILSFSEDALAQHEQDSLRKLTLTDSVFYLRDTPATILALKTLGQAPKGFEANLDVLFEAFLERWHRISDGKQTDIHANELFSALENEQLLALQAAIPAKPKKGKTTFKKGLSFAGLAIATLWLGLWSGQQITHSLQNRWLHKVETTLAVLPEAYGMPISAKLVDGRIVISGALITQAEYDSLMQKLSALNSPYSLVYQIRILN